jgi:hypothetical protein
MKIIIKPLNKKKFLTIKLFQHHRIFRLAFFLLWKIIQGENDCNHRFLCITELKENWKTTETRRRQYDRFRLRKKMLKIGEWVGTEKILVFSQKLFIAYLSRLFYFILFSSFLQILHDSFFFEVDMSMKFNWDEILKFLLSLCLRLIGNKML